MEEYKHFQVISIESYIRITLAAISSLHVFILLRQTHKKPVTEYEAIREKAASQKRDLERALNKFKTKTSETESLFFNSENDAFPRKLRFFQRIFYSSKHRVLIFFLFNQCSFSNCGQRTISYVSHSSSTKRSSLRRRR